MKQSRLYAVPYHEARLPGGRLVGMDAYFWPALEQRYRIVLLVQPADRLEQQPPRGACRLPARAEPGQQAEEIQRIANLTPPPVEAPRPSLLRRLAELVIPYKLLYMGAREPRVPEEAQARSLARLIGRPEPTGRLLWALFEKTPAGLLPRDEGMARIYSELRRRDPGYQEAEEEAQQHCR